MCAEDFNSWLEKEKLNDSAAARRLGVTRKTIAKYKLEGAPLHIALACAAISYGLPPWKVVEAAG